MRISDHKRNDLASHSWAIQTNQEKARNFIKSYSENHAMHAHSGFEPYVKAIRHSGKEMLVYILPFELVEFFVDNETSEQLEYTVYHDPKKDNLWAKWKKEKERTRKTKNLVQLGALMPRRSYRK